ncbi:hypothetical protein QAD02_005068 [Eretmocerus hayati]|uniref:Uncharacterized protein n=1 Tax=Eretmocerus hayati TaxID=131215 RepID=A0ACC2NRP2_9HYME|nr:hypothetical protein QAD02_005068 [Eretmocerus hayati]
MAQSPDRDSEIKALVEFTFTLLRDQEALDVDFSCAVSKGFAASVRKPANNRDSILIELDNQMWTWYILLVLNLKVKWDGGFLWSLNERDLRCPGFERVNGYVGL